jgi:DNA-nicking Smr family endonuclease
VEKPKPPEAKKKPTAPPLQFMPPKPPPPKSPPALAPLDRRTRSRVARGTVAIDRRIDLHGLTQTAAERRLDAFLHDAQMDGAKVVLVITGKGKAGDGARESERGVLRRMVPHWLASPTLRGVVIGFEEAAPNHGGAGALYVRIRRPK